MEAELPIYGLSCPFTKKRFKRREYKHRNPYKFDTALSRNEKKCGCKKNKMKKNKNKNILYTKEILLQQ